jgi:hypothetical protein
VTPLLAPVRGLPQESPRTGRRHSQFGPSGRSGAWYATDLPLCHDKPPGDAPCHLVWARFGHAIVNAGRILTQWRRWEIDPPPPGSQYASKDCSTWPGPTVRSFVQRYRAYDNAVAGSFFATIKRTGHR